MNALVMEGRPTTPSDAPGTLTIRASTPAEGGVVTLVVAFSTKEGHRVESREVLDFNACVAVVNAIRTLAPPPALPTPAPARPWWRFWS